MPKSVQERLEKIFIDRAKEAQSGYESESWILAAKTLASSNFTISHGAYTVHCSNRNLTAAAESLQQMYMHFNEEPKFWDEAYDLIQALKSDSKEDESAFRRDLFQTLVPVLQQSLLLEMAERRTDLKEQCELYLLLLRLFEESISMFGVQLIKVLLDLESQVECDALFLNPYTQLLVCDVLPVALKDTDLPLPEDQPLTLFRKSSDFILSYVSSTMDRNVKLQMIMQHRPPGKLWSQEISHRLTDAWELLLTLFHGLTARCDWKIGAKLKNLRMETMVVVVKLLTPISTTDTSPDIESNATSMFVFLFLVFRYIDLIKEGKQGAEGNVLVILPPIPEPESSQVATSPKRSRLDTFSASDLNFLPCGTNLSAEAFSQLFTLAVPCVTILDKSGTLQSLQKDAHVGQFLSDMQLFNHSYGTVIEDIKKTVDSVTLKPQDQLRCYLQLAGAHLVQGQCSSAARSIIKAVFLADKVNTSQRLTSDLPAAACLCLLSTEDVLAYSCRVILYSLYRKVVSGDSRCDESLGRALILLQADLKRFAPLFIQLCDLVVTWGHLAYPAMLNYVVDINLLQELAYISAEETKVVLEITPKKTPDEKQENTDDSESLQAIFEAKASQGFLNKEFALMKFLKEEGEKIVLSLL